MQTSLDNELLTRNSQLKMILSDLKSYRPDSQRILNAFLQRVNTLRPSLHNLLSHCYSESNQHTRERTDQAVNKTATFASMKKDLIAYVETKQNACQTQDTIAKVDLWTKKLVQNPTSEETIKKCFEASDHVEDVLRLATLSIKLQIDPTISKLSEEFDLLSSKIPSFASLIDTDLSNLAALIKEANDSYRSNSFDEALQKVNQIYTLIHPS